MKINFLNKLIDKSKDKADGVFSHKGVKYKVKNCQLTHVIEYNTIYSLNNNFLVQISKQFKYEEDAIKSLRSL